MKLIFIRHAEPDYENNTLTEKGFREAELLSLRTKDWKIDKIYSSPLKRALYTAKPTLDRKNMKAEIIDSFEEFIVPVREGSDERTIIWDFEPDYLDRHPELFNKDEWLTSEIMASRPVKEKYEKVINDFDNILASYGYMRNGMYYNSPSVSLPTNHYMVYDGRTEDHMKNAKVDDTTLCFFCHLGVMMVILSHLLNTTPPMLWHGMFVAPSSVTVLSSEERQIGSAYFRCQMLGDTSHLRMNNEKVSYYGYFTTPFQG